MEHPSLNVLAEQSRPIQQGLLANAVLYLLPLLIAVQLGTGGAPSNFYRHCRNRPTLEKHPHGQVCKWGWQHARQAPAHPRAQPLHVSVEDKTLRE